MGACNFITLAEGRFSNMRRAARIRKSSRESSFRNRLADTRRLQAKELADIFAAIDAVIQAVKIPSMGGISTCLPYQTML